LIVGLSSTIASLSAQLLKRTIFHDSPRPKRFFEGIHDLYFVPGIDNHMNFSFPSGHATSAFALYFSMALIITNKRLKLFLFIIALLAAYSRVYLSQHFFEDIYAGSIIGVITAFFIYITIQNIQSPKLDKSVISLFR
jgi:membrane-associated phospholipid phosphatase